MMYRGHSARSEERRDQSCPSPRCPVLDWPHVSPDEYEKLGLLPRGHRSLENEEDTNKRLHILEQLGDSWKQGQNTRRLVKRWTRSIVSEYSLSEDDLLSLSGVNDLFTLFLEFYWRVNFSGPGDALALVGVNRTIPQWKTYTRRVVGKDIGNSLNRMDMMSEARNGPPHGWREDHALRENRAGIAHFPYRPLDKPVHGPSYILGGQRYPTNNIHVGPRRAFVDIKRELGAEAPSICRLGQPDSHGNRGGNRRVATFSRGRQDSFPNPRKPLIPNNYLDLVKEGNESKVREEAFVAQQKIQEREEARMLAEKGISRFLQGPLAESVKVEVVPPKKRPLDMPPLKFNKKKRSASPIVPQPLPEDPLNVPPSLLSGSSPPSTPTTVEETVVTESTLHDEIHRYTPPSVYVKPSADFRAKIEDDREEDKPSLDFEMQLVSEEDCKTLLRAPEMDMCISGEQNDSAEAENKTATQEHVQPSPIPTRPAIPLRAYPPIWAETRQEVCETFEWFRSYQGGVYFCNDIVRGYMLGAFGAKRDTFVHDGRLIISHGGGRAESLHSENGQWTLRPAEDQRSDDKSVRALLKTYRERRPIALVIDDRYALFPYDLSSKGVTYAVLGFYMIVHAWAEYEADAAGARRVVKYKFAFQWCEGQGEPWWISESGKPKTLSFDEEAQARKLEQECELKEDSEMLDAVSKLCTHCGEDSPQVYLEGWACLHPSCPRFWQVPQVNVNDPPVYLPESLSYQEDFLKLVAPCPLPIGFETLRPPPVKQREDGVSTSRAFTRGFHCDKCGRMSCRVEWQRWRCSTIGCDVTYVVNGKIRTANEFWSQPTTNKYLTAHVEDSSGVRRLPSRGFFGEDKCLVGIVDTFILPHGRGQLHHIQPASPLNRMKANDIFNAYQEQANSGELIFKRWPMRSHKCRGALLTNYFSHNAGEPYHYVGGTDNTVPWDQAPSAVVQARELIQQRIFMALEGRKAEFNEVLSAAYMEKQKMAFHSDEEVGLGPFVAGLSLGSPAFMHFRLQRKHDKERLQKGILMSFVLRHGDIFVMDGLGVQNFYEHTVVPTNFRIAATARSINAADPLKDPTLLTLPCSFDPQLQTEP